MDQLDDFDFTNFWAKGEYTEKLCEAPPTSSTIALVETKLGHKLPASYKTLSKSLNGGLPVNRFHACPSETSYGAPDHIEIAEIYAIGQTAQYSLAGSGSDTEFWVSECGYPAIGVYFANCPDHGHQMLALDYRECGDAAEPSVVIVDEIEDFEVIKLANTFAEFIRGLKPEGHFEPPAY